MKNSGISLKAPVCLPFVGSRQYDFGDIGHQQSLNLNGSTDRGMYTSPHQLSRNQEEVPLNEAWAASLVSSQGGHTHTRCRYSILYYTDGFHWEGYHVIYLGGSFRI